MIKYVVVLMMALFGIVGISFSDDTVSGTKTDTMNMYKDPTTGMEFIFIKGGCYQMGNAHGEENEKPVHEVCIDDFFMGKYEVTVGEFRNFVQDTAYTTDAEKGFGCITLSGAKFNKSSDKSWMNPGVTQNDRNPVVCVTQHDMKEYTNWLSRKSGKSFRLPYEAEWEYAARSGGKDWKYSGGDDVDKMAWYTSNSENKLHEVGTKAPNQFGLYDMSGNVWEVMQDYFGKDSYTESPKKNPQGPINGQEVVCRGGSFFDKKTSIQVTFRGKVPKDLPTCLHGFRCVLTSQ